MYVAKPAGPWRSSARTHACTPARAHRTWTHCRPAAPTLEPTRDTVLYLSDYRSVRHAGDRPLAPEPPFSPHSCVNLHFASGTGFIILKHRYSPLPPIKRSTAEAAHLMTSMVNCPRVCDGNVKRLSFTNITDVVQS